jgi:hypothetical protein
MVQIVECSDEIRKSGFAALGGGKRSEFYPGVLF